MIAALNSPIFAMQAEERAIVEYLKGWPNTYVSGKEIARKVSRKKFEEDRGWAIPLLVRMVNMGTIETDHFGQYKLKIASKKDRKRRYMSPQMVNLLQKSGKSFETFVIDVDSEEESIPTFRPRKPIGPPDTAGVKKD
jgi:hypothetical protein